MQLYLKLVINLKKIRRWFIFDQYQWLKPCINFYIEKKGLLLVDEKKYTQKNYKLNMHL